MVTVVSLVALVQVPADLVVVVLVVLNLVGPWVVVAAVLDIMEVVAVVELCQVVVLEEGVVVFQLRPILLTP